MKTSKWIVFAFCWGLINLLGPQIYVNKLVEVEGSQGLHPFNKWRLFSGIEKTARRSGLEARNCQDHKGPMPFNPLGETFLHPGLRWRTKHRLNYIGGLLEAGDWEAARAALYRLSQRVLSNVIKEKCELQFYWYLHNGPEDKEKVFSEESRIAF